MGQDLCFFFESSPLKRLGDCLAQNKNTEERWRIIYPRNHPSLQCPQHRTTSVDYGHGYLLISPFVSQFLEPRALCSLVLFYVFKFKFSVLSTLLHPTRIIRLIIDCAVFRLPKSWCDWTISQPLHYKLCHVTLVIIKSWISFSSLFS